MCVVDEVTDGFSNTIFVFSVCRHEVFLRKLRSFVLFVVLFVVCFRDFMRLLCVSNTISLSLFFFRLVPLQNLLERITAVLAKRVFSNTIITALGLTIALGFEITNSFSCLLVMRSCWPCSS